MPREKIQKTLLRENKDCPNPASEELIYRDIKRAVDAQKAREANEKIRAKHERKRAAQASTAALPPKPPLEPTAVQTPAERIQVWNDVESFVKEHFLNPDIEAIKAIYATAGAHRIIDHPPTWPMLVAPSGSIKTTILNAMEGLPNVHFVDEITANTFISGKQDEPGEKRTAPAGLLHRIGDEGIIVSADFSTILELDEKTRAKIFAQLRRIYDGQFRREFGTGEHLEEREWKGRITFVAGVTPEIDRYHKVSQALGERSLKFRWSRMGGVEAALAAMKQTRGVPEGLKTRVHKFLRPVLAQPSAKPPAFSDEMLVRLGNFTELLALSRAHVPRDRDRDLDGMVQAESNTRLPQELAQLGRGWAVLMGHEQVTEEDFAIVVRAGWDTMPPARRIVLKALAAKTSPYKTGLPKVTVARELENLVAVGLAEARAGKDIAGGWKDDDYHVSEIALHLLQKAGLTLG